MTLFNDILVPIDYSAPADAALRLAARLARAAHGRVLVAHFLTPMYAMTEVPMLPADGQWIVEERTRLESHVRKRLAHDGDDVTPFGVEIRTDTPFLGIVRLAAEWKVDLIVIGTHGRSGLKRLALGSVTEKVVRFAPCPVLTVHGDSDADVGAISAEMRGAARPVVVRPGTVAELIYRTPIVVQASATLADARDLLVTHGVRHLPVVEGGRLVGILSDADLGPYVGYFDHTKVNAAMTPNPTTVAPDANAALAARLMLEHKVRALPVTDGENVIGVVSVSDVLEEYLRAARQ